ncbi:hypothetical protein V9T40_014873 [Parthenolecanium corni]|uniref:RING-type domain-containing protein n=1 Tax=Parthenolecanium corni TaxID=536013 RepID=A0AAN9TNZ6_9HEMI
MPTSLSRLSSCLSSILSFLECPICFEIISPPAHQCPLGHLICFRCRVYIDRCPICRTGFTRERSLLADQIYNSIIEAFHLNNHSTSDRTRKLWERVFGRKKRDRASTDKGASQPSTPRLTMRAFDIKNKFLTRLIGKSSSVNNLANESMFEGGRSAALRKKSISSTDLYQPPETSLKKLASLQNSRQGSVESLSTHENGGGDSSYDEGALQRYSTPNSCETLNVPRSANVQCFKRLRNRNLNSSFNSHQSSGADNPQNLFQFSSDADPEDGAEINDCFHCPLSDGCDPRTAFSLLTHLQEHDGPVIQYFKPNFKVRFPFSFENGAVFIVHCYEKTFYTRLYVDEESGGDIKVYFWIMDGPAEASQFKLNVAVRDEDSGALLEFKTVPNSLRSTESADDVYRYQMLITKSTLQIIFGEKSYLLDLHLKKRKNHKPIS